MRRHPAGNRVTLKHIKRVAKPSGLVILYLAVPGRKLIRLPDLPMQSPEFIAAHSAAMMAARAPAAAKGIPRAKGSVGAALIAYQRSSAFTGKAEGTKRQRGPILSKIADMWGHAKLADLKTAHIEADIAKVPPHAGNNRLKTWRGFTAWASKEGGLMATDPAKDAGRRIAPRSEGHAPWGPDDIARFRARWGEATPQRLAMELIYWTAARASDATRLGPGMIDKAGWLTFRQQKTGGEVAIPFSRALPDFARGMAGDLAHLKAAIEHAQRHMTWIVTEAGAARSVKAFSQWFSAAARAAGVIGKTAHGLRKSRAVDLAEAEATTHQIAAWTGHETLSEVERYTKAAGKRRLLSGTEPERKLETVDAGFQKLAEKP